MQATAIFNLFYTLTGGGYNITVRGAFYGDTQNKMKLHVRKNTNISPALSKFRRIQFWIYLFYILYKQMP